MQAVIVIVFFVLVVLFGFFPMMRKRSKRENVFYAFSILISFVTMLVKSLF